MSAISGDAFVAMAERIVSKEDFTNFVKAYLANFRQHPEEWENDSIDSFLGGLLGFLQNCDGYYRNLGLESDLDQLGWRMFADMLLAARVYE